MQSYSKFKRDYSAKKNQVLYKIKKVKNDHEIIKLIDDFLVEKNSFIFESVEKGKIKGRYTIFGKNPDKIWEFNNRNSYLIQNNKKGERAFFYWRSNSAAKTLFENVNSKMLIAKKKNISGVPFYEIGNDFISGAQSANVLENVIKTNFN